MKRKPGKRELLKAKHKADLERAKQKEKLRDEYRQAVGIACFAEFCEQVLCEESGFRVPSPYQRQRIELLYELAAEMGKTAQFNAAWDKSTRKDGREKAHGRYSMKDVLEGSRTWEVIQGDALEVLRLMPSGVFNAVVTSPPYWSLRDYKVAGQIGLEKTPEEFVERLCGVFDEVRRVLREDGLVWCNIGDSYSTQGGLGVQGKHGQCADRAASIEEIRVGRSAKVSMSGVAAGNLCLIPFRFALAMQARGWYVRSDVAWTKPSAMPESVAGWRWERCRVKKKPQGKSGGRTLRSGVRRGLKLDSAGLGNSPPYPGNGTYRDAAVYADCPGCPKCKPNDGLVLRRGSWRPTRSWEHVFMFAKSEKYFADGEPVRTRLAEATLSRDQYSRVLEDPDEQFAVAHDHESTGNPAGANLRDVWSIGPEPLKEKHYAAFPSELPMRCLKSSLSEKGYCAECGGPWVRVLGNGTALGDWNSHKNERAEMGHQHSGLKGSDFYAEWQPRETLGWRPSCKHTGEPQPGLVLDPFCGSGRTIIAALRLGHRAIGIELSPTYADMARRLIVADAPLLNAV